MTLDQLRYFQAVCQYNGVSRAAEALHISQPSISGAIHKLEEEFGVMLFTRQNKKLTLTKEGISLYEMASDLLLRAENTAKTMTGLSDHKVLNLGIPPMLSSLILPMLYGDFFKQHPDVEIKFFEDDRSGLVQMLDENKINMAFLPHEGPVDGRFHARALVELDNVCCVPKKHPLAKKEALAVEDVKDEPFILFKNSFFQTKRLLERFRQHGLSPNVLLNTTQVSTVQNMVSSGLAISIIFEFLIESTPNVVGIQLDPPMHTQVSLVWKQGEYLSGHMHRLIEFVKDYSSRQ